MGRFLADRSPASRNARLLYTLDAILTFQPHVAIWVVYLTDFRDISLAQVGIMEGFFWAVKIFLEVPSGAFADRYGRRVGFAAALVIEGAGVVLFGLASNYPLLLTSYVLWSAGLAFRSGNDEAFLYDWLSSEGRGAEYGDRMGVLQAIGTSSFALGGLVGAGLAAATNLQVGVLAAATLYLVSAPVVLLMREPPRHAASGTTSYLATLRVAGRAFRADPALRYVVLFQVLMSAAYPAHFLLAQPFLNAHAVPLVLFGVLEIPARLSGAAAATQSGRLMRRIGPEGVLRWTVAGVGGGLLLLGAVDHVVAFGGFAVMSVALGLSGPAISAYINDRTESHVRATVLSVGPLGTSVVFTLVAPFLGVVGDASLRLAFLGVGAAIVGTTVPAYLAWRRADAGERVPVGA